MAINLMTGLPGACKTLYSLAFIKEWAERENRPVFYSGVKDLAIPDWTEIDAEKWFECPPNSIVLIDECQRVFRPRAASKEPPKYVSELETHRHQGIDLWLITQHPNLCDIAVRRLTQRHLHAHRIFGMQKATIHEWQGAQTDCEKESAKKKSIKKIWNFDKKAFAYYKSAEVHTVKRSIPKQVILLFILPVILLLLIYAAYQQLKPKPIPNAPGATAATLVNGARANPNAPPLPVFDPVADAKNYVNLHTPRYAGLPQTAPIYDELRKPTEAPLPVACVKSSLKCSCFTQQATPIAMPRDMCLQIVENGFFDDARPKKESGSTLANAPQSQPLHSAGAVPVSAVNDRVAVIGDGDGYGVLGRRGGERSQSAL